MGMMLSAAHPVQAATQDVRVLGVGNDSSSVKAEAKALEYAKKRAVFLAARKMGVKDASASVAKFTEQQFKDIVRGTVVTQSRRAGEITYSDVTVTVVDDVLRRALKLPALSRPEAEPLRPVLLLSVYVGETRAFMWEKENILRVPLADEVRRQAHGEILLPGGDLEDLRLVDYQNALTVKPDELKPMFARYGAEEIIIAVFKPGAAGTMDPSSAVLRRLKLDSARDEVIEIFPESPEEISSARLMKAAAAIATAVTQIASSTAEREQLARDRAKKIPVRFAYTIPKDLARMQEAVRASPEVLSLEQPSIALSQVEGVIYLNGEEETLKATLKKKGIIVTVLSKGWQLSTR
jgi:hypothetical protein